MDVNMGVPGETPATPSTFTLLVTSVDGVGPFVRLYGQTNKSSGAILDQLLTAADPDLRAGKGALPPGALVAPGWLCLAQYKDGSFYRARVLDARDGIISVQFIDYGNRDTVTSADLRILEQFSAQLTKLPPLASEYILARGAHPLGTWDEPSLASLQRCLCSREYPCVVEARLPRWITISIPYSSNTLVEYLIACKFCVPISAPQQADLLNQLAECVPFMPPPRTHPPPEVYTEHVVPFPNRGFPSNPAATMRMQNLSGSLNANYLPGDTPHVAPSAISQRLQVHRSAPRNVTHLRPLQRTQYANGVQEQPAPMSPAPVQSPVSAAPTQSTVSPGSSPRKTTTYKSRLLEVHSEHKVCVSFARDGPELFAVQLASEACRLKDMMCEINKLPHRSLTEPPMIGTVCLGRMSGDRTICRAIVMNICGSQCKLFFVDFGDTELVSYYDIFDIPEQFVKPGVYALRFCLSGLSQLKKSPALNEAFQQLVELKKVTLRVVTPEGPPLIQYGELFVEGRSVLEILKEEMGEGLEMKYLAPLQTASTSSALVSYVDSCHKFFIQLSDNIDILNEVMAAVETHCKAAPPLSSVREGAACCALFPEDGVWYRAQVVEARGDKALVCYVDYGNEQEVGLADLRPVTAKLLELPAQALKCALKGFEDKPVDQMTSNQLEMLALERTTRVYVDGHLDSGAMLVTLVHDGVNPPIDIAKRMLQLSRPPNSARDKPSRAPPPTSPPPVQAEQVSSPDSDKGDRNRFRSDKYFRDDKRRDDDWQPRGGSFRQKDKPASKPWERNHEQHDNERGESNAASRPFRDRDNFKKEDTWNDEHDHRDKDRGERKERGVGDRPRRDNNWEKKDTWGEKKDTWGEKKDTWGDKKDTWGEKKDTWGEKNDTWGDKKDTWGDKKENFPKKSFQERGERNFDRGERNIDRGDRGDRNFDRGERKFDKGDRNFGERKERSNFTPRDRAERSFDGNRSFGSNKSVKELSSPVPLDTQFTCPDIEIGSQLEVSIAWFTSPDNFYAQITSEQSAFTDIMNKIPEMYKGIKPYSGTIDVGSSVLARFPEDRVLYRATVMGVQPFGKYIVQYIDFGNKTVVDTKDIWQLDQELMKLPKMAVQCSLIGVGPPEKDWPKSKEMDLCFNAPRYQCVFTECSDGIYKVSLWNNGASVAELLAEKGLAILEEQSSITLKDEPIDLSIVLGQELLCRVTHIVSIDKFHVQLDLEKAALVEATIAQMDRTTLQPLPAETIVAGTHCVLTHDEKLHRAILEDVTDHGTVTAQLPDYGYSVTVPTASLYILPMELSTYYYQSLVCRFNNYDESATRLLNDEELVATLKDNKFIMYINDVDGTTLVSTLYDLAGQKLCLFEPDEGAFPTVVPVSARAVYNYNFGTAYLTHAESLGQLYLQKASDEAKVAELLDKLFKFYEEGTPESLESYDEEALCGAKSSDGNWYRAIIMAPSDDTCKVQFIDYGNMEDVAKDSIKKLDPSFYEPYCLALVVSLGLTPLQDDAVDKLTEMLTDKEVLVTLTIGDEGWLANLHLNGEDLSLKLVNDKVAAPQVPSAETIAVPLESQTVPEGTVQVYIAHVDTPGQFWLQMSDKVDKIEEIQAELQEKSTSYPELENKEMGTLCVAKYTVDDMWYRAEVLDSDTDITTVRFIDYGNTDVLDNIPGVLKVIPDHLKELEKFAVKSGVNAVPTGTGQWSEAATDYFTELVGDMSAPLDALIVLKDVTTYVDLFVNGQNLTDKLVSANHATRSEKAECGDLASCFASHVNSPSEFWIQLENCTAELQEMEAAMSDCENFPELTDKEEGTLCAAKYPEDGCWYRGQIIVEGSEGIEVLFMDYGNASIVTDLRCLPDELKAKPALSRKCALQKPRDIKTWSRKSELKFNDMAAEGATIFNVQFIASGDISIVELYLEGKSVTEELATLCEAPPATERPTPLGQELLTSGTISHANNPGDFYFLIQESTGKMAPDLTTAESFAEVTEVKVGSLVAAQWDEDELWYRAKVIELCDTGAHVQFLDYGNKAKCDKFRQLPEDIAAVEPLSMHCGLVGYGNESDEKQTQAFQALVENPDNTFQIEFLDTTKDPRVVRLRLKNEDVCILIKQSDSLVADENVDTETVPVEESGAVAVEVTTVQSELATVDMPVITAESITAQSELETSNVEETINSEQTNTEEPEVQIEFAKIDDDSVRESFVLETNTVQASSNISELDTPGEPEVLVQSAEAQDKPLTHSLELNALIETTTTEYEADTIDEPEILAETTLGSVTEPSELEMSLLNESLEANITVIENKEESEIEESPKEIVELDESGPIESEEFTTPHCTSKESSPTISPRKKFNLDNSFTSTSGKSDSDDVENKAENIVDSDTQSMKKDEEAVTEKSVEEVGGKIVIEKVGEFQVTKEDKEADTRQKTEMESVDTKCVMELSNDGDNSKSDESMEEGNMENKVGENRTIIEQSEQTSDEGKDK